jgi:hypothetical protein
LTESNEYKASYEVLNYSSFENELFTDQDIFKFLKKSFLNKNVKMNEEILEILEIKSFTKENLMELIKNEEWLRNHDKEWFKKFYNYLGII